MPDYIDLYANHTKYLHDKGEPVTAILDTTEEEVNWMRNVRKIMRREKREKKT